MLRKVEEELQRMERNDIIVRVTQSTYWCAPGGHPCVQGHRGRSWQQPEEGNAVHWSDGLKLDSKKGSIKQSQVQFLGHLIDRSWIQPNLDKMKAFRQLSQTGKIYCPPFNCVTANVWTFERIKELLTTTPVLASPGKKPTTSKSKRKHWRACGYMRNSTDL